MDNQRFLNSVKEVLHNIEQKAANDGGSFNIFSILGVEHYEVTTHSALLRELLDPKGSHAQGDKFLKVFLEIIDFVGFDTKKADVYAELDAGSGLGRMDIVLDEPKNLIVIENKIYADDQPDQLERYDKYSKKQNKNYKIFYLTLDGKEANKNDSEGVKYKTISYKSEILKWMEECEKIAPVKIAHTLKQYGETIRKLTNQASKEIEMELEKLLENIENLKMANEIYKAFPNILAKKEVELWGRFANFIESTIEIYGYKTLFDKDDLLTELQNRPKSGVNCIWIKTKEHQANGAVWLRVGFDGYNTKLYIALDLYDDNENYLGQEESVKISSQLGVFENKKNYRYFGEDLDFYNSSIIGLLEEQKEKQVFENIKIEIERCLGIVK